MDVLGDLQNTCVLILDWRDASSTLQCLASVPGGTAAVIVVANEWSEEADQAGELLALANNGSIELLALPENRGFAAGVNEGLRHIAKTTPDMNVLLLNNDARLMPGALERMTHVLGDDRTVGIVGARVLEGPDGASATGAGVLRPWAGVVSWRGAAPIDFVSGACALIRSAVLRDIGLLDESYFMYWEDVEYSMRARAHGWRVVVCTSALVEHAGTASRASAGGLIDAYYTWSSLVFARATRGPWRVSVISRVCARILQDWLYRNSRWRFSRAGLSAARRARPGPAWKQREELLSALVRGGGSS